MNLFALELGEDRHAIFVRHLNFALDEWQRILVELVAHGDTVFVDPVFWKGFHAVGDFGKRCEASFASVGVAFAAEECDHGIGLTSNGCLDCSFTRHEGFVVVSL